MGRKPYKNTNLPKGMRKRVRGKNTYYYLDTGNKPRKEIPLGKDYTMAVMQWSELTMKKPPSVITFAYVAEKYFEQVVPTKAQESQNDNKKEIVNLLEFFDNPPAPIDLIEPKHIRQYLDWRVEKAKQNARLKNRPVTPTLGSVRANREKSLFSHIFNFAREYGYTSKENPCRGIKGFKETGRNVYVSDNLLKHVLNAADKPTQFALQLAYLTGQRPGDVLKMKVSNIHDGYIHLRQAKTKEPVRILVTGELKTLLDEINHYKSSFTIQSLSVLVNDNGKALTAGTLRGGFDRAREAAGIDKKIFQFRDLRAKAATDIEDESDIKEAQTLLGHTTPTMTEHYVRRRLGKKANPVK